MQTDFTAWVELIKNISSIIMSIVGTIVAVIVARKQNKIHKNSYKPYCDICCIDYNKKIAIKIKNNGKGVMTITSFEVHERNRNTIHKNLYSCISEDIQLTHYSVDIVNKSIAPEGELLLIKKEEPKVDDDISREFKKLRKELNKFIIKIEYIDMYGGKHTSEKDLFLIYGEKRRLSKEEYERKHNCEPKKGQGLFKKLNGI